MSARSGPLRVRIIARGRIGRGPEADLVRLYLDRLPWPSEVIERPDHDRTPLPLADGHSRTVLLDEKGEAMGSEAFADRIGRWRDDGVREIRFALGGADGFTDTERQSADLLIAFGRMTWPHLMARAMLAEQLFRASAILAGHPYHRAG